MSNYPIPDSATLVRMYEKMELIRLNDERAHKVVKTGRIVMPYYSPRGQEVIPSAISVNLTEEDYICTIYRGTHDMLAKGVPPKLLWAELAGRVTGTCKGKGGPMHITHPETGVMVTTGVVGSSMPIANGLAWASQLSGDDRVTIANFGDGAANIGAFHESLNLAALWKLPVVFVCQNNRYAEHTTFANSTAVDRIGDRAASYAMPGITVDGNDPEAMYGAAKIAIDRAKAGEGPTLIEAMTYRFNGHLLGDDGHYMDKEERQKAIDADPVARLRARLISDGVLSEADADKISADITAQLDEAIAFALDSDFPTLDELRRDVFATELA
ncbi:thiamine pyrophosphate-dependent dehydrogenase E1 component subunit alpha [Aurantiacibacter rhizosphaerae]|uniref:Thiamine pyrophosphate-dependent dehydrogenase E1 component subunit alpha n=1 Tax=Aurantiacibacter rhizosphaerae TaxID=2691582 RepID=A0A844XFB9_9SPHN|nr:thiamine pyrophosphate-dependent dehydrogenase E1 component subunit alpha [Aurantiacibacter rhizosphaerae]MWV29301.1 thiamine pyrophosphate-dependent dehydrogenase E1 component subunit alpha [Aurantiacibacter rhizosphaerae]